MSKRKSIAKEDELSTKKTKSKEVDFEEQKARAAEWAQKEKAKKSSSRKSIAPSVPVTSDENEDPATSFAHQKVRALEWALKQQMEDEKNKAGNKSTEDSIPASVTPAKPKARKTRTKILVNEENSDNNV